MQHAADLHGWTRFVSMQDQYSLLQREEEREMFGLLADPGVGSIPWCPLAAGRVARRGASRAQPGPRPARRRLRRPAAVRCDTDEAIVDAVQQIAEARGVSMARSRWPGC